jgi:hypothetical protein
MNMKKTFALITAVCVLWGITFLSLTGCGGDDDTHKHSFGTAWISNETHHWHECSCGEKSELANHTFENGICVCGAETPITQNATITGLFDNDASATVTGTFTNAEWAGVADIMKTALKERFAEVSDTQKNAFRNVYTEKSVTIVLEKNPTYANYNAPTLNGDTVYINFAILNDKEALGLALSYTNQVMRGNTDTPQQG